MNNFNSEEKKVGLLTINHWQIFQVAPQAQAQAQGKQ